MKQFTLTRSKRNDLVERTLANNFSKHRAKAIREATRAPDLIRGVLVPDSRVRWRALSTCVDTQALTGICFAVVPILFPNFKPPQCDHKPANSTAVAHIVLELAS